jgi:anaerobic selenocysteine-containing dehydrogenase
MSSNTTVKSTCGLCNCGCGVTIHMSNGKPVKIEGDPQSPRSKGYVCIKGRASLEYLYHPDRLKHPLKRTGNRGEGKWKQVTWEEALTTVSSGLQKAIDRYGKESIAVMRGAAKGYQDTWLKRFANVLGTPNFTSKSHVCHVPRELASLITYGYYARPDYAYPPKCVIIWGGNPENIGEYRSIRHSLDRGTKLVIIDPSPPHPELTQRAELIIKPKPGTDLIIALGMISVIINQQLYDTDFTNNHATGFDELKQHLLEYPAPRVEEITHVDFDSIQKAAEIYSKNSPACIEWGNSIDHTINSFQTARAICILRAISGNLDVPGGEIKWSNPQVLGRTSPQLELTDKLDANQRKKNISNHLNLIPLFKEALPQNVIKSIVSANPYAISAAYVQGCNPLLSCANSVEVHNALMKLEFLVVADMFMTPSAAIADVVLPVASYLEFDSISPWPPGYGIYQIQQKVAKVGEARSDYWILKELSKKMQLSEYFWDEETEALDYILSPCGITFEEFRSIGTLNSSKKYRTYRTDGFRTPSRRAELYSKMLKRWNFDPLPIYTDQSNDLSRELEEEWPLILTSRKSYYRHSEGRQISTLRGNYPEPVCLINTKTAMRLGLRDGELAVIETNIGVIQQIVRLDDNLHAEIVYVDYAWWFPEEPENRLFGWRKSNINMLTDNGGKFGKEMGSLPLRGVRCRLKKCDGKVTS